MAHREVVVLDVVLDQVLPVDVYVENPEIIDRHHLFDAVVSELCPVRLHAFGDTLFARAKPHEHHPHEHFELDRFETELRTVELRKGVRSTDAAIASVQMIGPAVIRARQEFCAATPLAAHHRMRAMRADVVEGPQGAGVIAHHETAPAKEFERNIVACSSEVTDVTDDLPGRQE